MDPDDIPRKHEVMAGTPRHTLQKIVTYLGARKGWSSERIAELFEDAADYARDPHRADGWQTTRTLHHEELVDEDDPDGTAEAAAERIHKIHGRLGYHDDNEDGEK